MLARVRFVGVTILGAILLLTSGVPAQAATIRWHLEGFTFTDGGSVTGYFDWDTATNFSTNYNVQVSGGNTALFPERTYTVANSAFLTGTSPDVLYFFDNPRVFRIGLASLDLLDTPSPLLALTASAQTGSGGFVECMNCLPARFGPTPATAHLSAVPEPATLLLSSLGAGLAAMRRRRLSTA